MKKVCSLLLVFIILLTTAVSVGAAARVKLSSDMKFLHIENADALPEFDERFSSVKEIYFTDCVINKNLLLWAGGKVEKITFDNCKYKVSTLSFPEGTREVTFENTISDNMYFLGELSKLKKISVHNCKIGSLEMFSKADTVENVSFNSCTIGSLKGIDGMKALKSLGFNSTKIDTTSGIEKLSNLEYLTLKDSSVREVSNLQGLNIRYLNIDNCVNIKNLDVITTFPKLEQLFADNCEMAVTEKLISYLEKNDIKTNLNRESLEIKNHVRKIYKTIIKKGMTKEEIIGTVVAYVCDNISYDKKAESDERLYKKYRENRLKFALSGRGVDVNYATFTTVLLNEAGINCYEVEGEEKIWNLVEADGSHYWLDVAEIDKSKTKKLGDSDWFMMSGNVLPQSRSYSSLPSPAYINPGSMESTYNQTIDFVLGKSITVSKPGEDETVTEEESATEEESTTEEETTTSEVTEEITEEETVTKERPRWYTETFIDEDEGKTMGKIVVAVFSALAVFIGAFFIIRRYREKY